MFLLEYEQIDRGDLDQDILLSFYGIMTPLYVIKGTFYITIIL